MVCGHGATSRLPLTHAQHNLAERMPAGQPFVRLRGIREREGGGDWHLELRGLDGAVEALKLAGTYDMVISPDADSASVPRRRSDTDWIREPTAGSQRFEAARERRPTRQSQRGVGSSWSKAAHALRQVLAMTFHCNVGTQLKRQLHAVSARGGREHPCSPLLRELDGERADPAGRPMNDESSGRPDLEHVVDPLKRGERRQQRRCVLEIDPPGKRETPSAETVAYSA